LLLFFSCTTKKKKADILSENKMEQVMWDMIRADQYVLESLSKDSSLSKKEKSIRLYEEIFAIHKITKEQFKKSLQYYSSQPDLFRPILDSLAKHKNESNRPSYIPPHIDTLSKPSLRRHFPKP
jgi:hypothetical protein